MKSKKFTTTVLTADEGMFLTNSGEDIDIKERVIARTVALGKYDSASNYKEITAEEAGEYLKQQEQARAEEAAAPAPEQNDIE